MSGFRWLGEAMEKERLKKLEWQSIKPKIAEWIKNHQEHSEKGVLERAFEDLDFTLMMRFFSTGMRGCGIGMMGLGGLALVGVNPLSIVGLNGVLTGVVCLLIAMGFKKYVEKKWVRLGLGFVDQLKESKIVSMVHQALNEKEVMDFQRRVQMLMHEGVDVGAVVEEFKKEGYYTKKGLAIIDDLEIKAQLNQVVQTEWLGLVGNSLGLEEKPSLQSKLNEPSRVALEKNPSHVDEHVNKVLSKGP